jgi:hypothetical protein
LQLAIPTVVNRHLWRHRSRGECDLADVDVRRQLVRTTIGTQVTATTVRPILNRHHAQRSRGQAAADLLLMSAEHYAAYDAATVAIQRINDETELGKLGFQSLKYFGAGRKAEIVQDGGIGSNMPSNTTYGIDTDNLCACGTTRSATSPRSADDDADQPGRGGSVHRLHGRADHGKPAVQLEALRLQPGSLIGLPLTRRARSRRAYARFASTLPTPFNFEGGPMAFVPHLLPAGHAADRVDPLGVHRRRPQHALENRRHHQGRRSDARASANSSICRASRRPRSASS